MLSATLFLGLPIDPTLEAALSRVSPALLEQFTQGGDAYLEFFEQGDLRYLGKAVGPSLATSRIDLVRDNILSLIQRLLPKHHLDPSTIQLIAQATG